jgi:VIT1/CCC1 family predicted Fe2+/Mn2+ transporter
MSASATPPPPIEHHHRNIQGGAARAAVFGLNDGLVSNVAIILGMAGANAGAGVVRLAGLAGLIGGAFSMASGEYGSMKAQSELLEAELEMERVEIERRPENERRELAAIYRSRGIEPAAADEMATQMHRDPDLALETHAREELGIDPTQLGSPVRAAGSSFIAFALGALIPLVPWFFGSGDAATIVSAALGVVAAAGVGVVLSRFTGRSALRTARRYLALACLAAGVTYVIGSLVGLGASAVG